MAKIPTSDKDSHQDSSVTYKECWKNHAVLIGGFAADGCGEFIPKGTEGSKDGLICEACGCHRNFHRKEVKRNGVVVVGSHHLPPVWAQINEVCVSSDPFSSSFCCFEPLEDSGDVSDEESVVCSAQPTKKFSD